MRAACAITFGRAPAAITAGGARAELDKRVAALAAARPCLFLDNVNATTLRSELLASILSEAWCEARPLGRSAVVRLEVSAFVAVTGNGLAVAKDLARRFLVVNLDARVEDPEVRPLPPGFDEEIAARRAELLAACLTIWRWGQREGAALPHGRPLGSYERCALGARPAARPGLPRPRRGSRAGEG